MVQEYVSTSLWPFPREARDMGTGEAAETSPGHQVLLVSCRQGKEARAGRELYGKKLACRIMGGCQGP